MSEGWREGERKKKTEGERDGKDIGKERWRRLSVD